MSRLSANENSLIITFRYHPKLLNVIRAIDGRIFNKEKRRWEVPKENVIETWDALKPEGFIADLDVLALYDQRKKDVETVMEIKRTDSPYAGNLPLYDFQKNGAAFLRALPAALLADVPGLGKTLQTCACFEDLKDGQVLIFVPASLKFNWHDEIKKWLPNDKVLVIHGDKKTRTEQWLYALKGMPRGNGRQYPKWVIANYELLIHDIEQLTSVEKEWAGIVCDEADRISNPFAQTTRNIKRIRSKKRIALTGTPISNTPEDLYSIVDWLYPRYLGTYPQFQKKYCVIKEFETEQNGRTQKFKRVIQYTNLDQLKQRVEPIMLRRLKEQVLKDFPPKTVEYVKFDLSKDERKLYEAVKKMVIQEIQNLSTMSTRSLALTLVKMLRLKQATDHPTLVGAQMTGSKIETLKEMLKPIARSGEKAIIFTQFASMASILANELKEYYPLVIKGDVDAFERKKIADNFQGNPDRKVLIMTEAGTYGLNLQAATYVFHYDAPWSVSKVTQREDRAHRIGQDSPVTVYHLIAKRTIDEYVLKVLAGKQKMSQELLGDGVVDMTEVTLDDLDDLLAEDSVDE